MYLGIDAGGTHTDAVLVRAGSIVASAKVLTCHDDLPSSVRAVLAQLPVKALKDVSRVTLGTTLAVNAIIQGRIDPVGLALSAGPGMNPARFGMGEHVHVVEGGLDHRGEEVTPLDISTLHRAAAQWRQAGVKAFAAVGKFSTRNSAHEQAMAQVLQGDNVTSGANCVVQGHQLSGQLHFPRRIATAFYNAAVWRVHNTFLDAVEAALAAAHVHAPVRLLKADGGAIALSLSRHQPVQSILSGPAASVMGVMALGLKEEDSILLDIGGTTTDIALFAKGSPVLDRDGMRLQAVPSAGGQDGTWRSTLVRALAFTSIGIGGDSVLSIQPAREEGSLQNGHVRVGPQRVGPAMAFGGQTPTLMDALIVAGHSTTGNATAAREGLSLWAKQHGLDAQDAAQKALAVALDSIADAVKQLLLRVNAHPVYTLAALLEDQQVRPQSLWLVGGPAEALCPLLQARFALPVHVPPCADVANAVGAALTLPTAGLELFADTNKNVVRIPFLDINMPAPRAFSLRDATELAQKLLHEYLVTHGQDGGRVEITESQLFATLDDRGRGGKDIRVSCQLVPGIVEAVTTV